MLTRIKKGWRLARRFVLSPAWRFVRDMFERAWFWIILTFALLIGEIVLTVRFWDWLDGEAPPSETIRNLGFIIAGSIALPIAIWRGIVADRQASAARRQSETALTQTDTAQQSLLNERYQKGAEMLGSEVLSVRLAGIYALRRLAEDSPGEYHIQAMELLCAFVRHPTLDVRVEMDLEEDEDVNSGRRKLRPDLEAAIRVMAFRGDEGFAIERCEDFRLFLRSAKLSFLENRDARLAYAWLSNADLSQANLRRGDLTGARLRNANLSGAKLWNAALRGANMRDANLRDADLTGADMSNLDMSEAAFPMSSQGKTALTQSQLDQAIADPDNPPKLDGVMDADTGKPLVWRGRAAS